MIKVHQVEYCKIQVKYQADPDMVVNKRNEVIDHFKDRDIPGFRKGKATKDIARFYFQKEIKEALTKELANQAVADVMTEHNVKPFGYPSFDAVSLENNDFKCEFTIHQKPAVELKQYKQFEIPKPAANTNAEEFAQRILQELRVRHGQTTPYGEEDFVVMDDSIILEYQAFIDDQPVEEVKSTGELGRVGKLGIPGMDDNLLGMKLGEERQFYLQIPADFKSEKLAGKLVKFQTKLLMGAKTVPLALDEELAKAMQIDSFAALMEQVKMTASSRVKEMEKEAIWDQISQRLLEEHQFPVPTWISIAEAQMSAKNSKQNWDMLSDEERAQYIAWAEKNVRLALILEKVREEEPDAQLTDEEVYKVAQMEVSKFAREPQKAIQEMFNSGYLPMFFNRIRDDYTLGFIERNCNITE